MDVKKIVAKYLLENGFDGLVEYGSDCGCEISDLMPCESSCYDCEPGYKRVADPSTGWDFTISTTKQ